MSRCRKLLGRSITAFLLCLTLLCSAEVALPKGKPERSTERKWEYCLIKETTGRYKQGREVGYYAEICYATISGCRMEAIEGANFEDALIKAIAKLGNDGWEMVGGISDSSYIQGQGNGAERLYFKHQVQ